MLANILSIGVSLLLFGYWFRYTCLLILNTKTAIDYSAEVAVENRLSFPQVKERLATSEAGDLRSLEMALQRDFHVVTSLLEQAGQLSIAGGSFEEVMLKADFWFLRACYGISRRFSEARARETVTEMCTIVGHLANTFGERVVAVPAAK